MLNIFYLLFSLRKLQTLDYFGSQARAIQAFGNERCSYRSLKSFLFIFAVWEVVELVIILQPRYD